MLDLRVWVRGVVRDPAGGRRLRWWVHKSRTALITLSFGLAEEH